MDLESKYKNQVANSAETQTILQSWNVICVILTHIITRYLRKKPITRKLITKLVLFLLHDLSHSFQAYLWGESVLSFSSKKYSVASLSFSEKRIEPVGKISELKVAISSVIKISRRIGFKRWLIFKIILFLSINGWNKMNKTGFRPVSWHEQSSLCTFRLISSKKAEKMCQK